MPLPFVKASTATVRDREISPLARFLYVVLGTYADLRTREAVVTRPELGADIGKSVDTVDRLMRELVRVGKVHVVRVRDGGVNLPSIYTLLDADDVLRQGPQESTGRGAGDLDDASDEASAEEPEVAAPVRPPGTPEEEAAGSGGRMGAATPGETSETNSGTGQENDETAGPDGRTHAATVAAPMRLGGRTHAAQREKKPSRDKPTPSVSAAAPTADPEPLFPGYEPPATDGHTVQALVGAWADAVTQGRGIPTKAKLGAIGKHVKRLMRDDHLPEPVLLVAVQRAGAARSIDLDRYLGGLQEAYDRRTATSQAMDQAWDDIATRIKQQYPDLNKIGA